MAQERLPKRLPTTLGAESWTINLEPFRRGKAQPWGLCHHDLKQVQIDPRVFDPAIVAQYAEFVSPREIALHEAVHAICPWLDEPFVNRMAKELDDYLDTLEL